MAVLTDHRAGQTLNPGDILHVSDQETYTIGTVIGYGGNAIVYEATKQNGNTLAVKEIFPADPQAHRSGGVVRFAHYPEKMARYADRLDKEIALGSAVRTSAVRVVGLWKRIFPKSITIRGSTYDGDGGIFALMEDMTPKGMVLEALLSALPDSHGIFFAAAILEEVLKAVRNVHRLGMVFGDISLTNLWFSEPRPDELDVGICNLLDFGSARYLDDRSEDRFSTPGFIPPEMVEGELPDQRGDLYSAGCLLLYCLNRSISFGDSPIYRQMLFNRNDAFLLGGCSERAFKLIHTILKNTMTEEPEDRYDSADIMLEEVQKLKAMCRPPEFPLPGLPLTGSAFTPNSRDREIEAYRRTLENGQPVYIWGVPGVGKSETAIALAKTVDGYGTCFLRCHVPENREQEFVEESILRMPLEGYYFAGTPHASPAALRWQEFRDRLRLLKKHATILILDNFDCPQRTLDDLRSERAYRELMQLRIPVIFTTRYRVDGQRELSTLPEDVLMKLMRRYCPDPKVTEEDFLLLMRSVDHNTLVCELIAKTLGSSHRTVTTEQILKGLAVEGPRVHSDKDQDYRTEILYTHIKQLMDVLTLTEDQKQVMACCSLLPDQGMEYSLLHSALDRNTELDVLSRCGWLKCSDDEIITIHPMVREVCTRELQPSDERCGNFLGHLFTATQSSNHFQTQIAAADCLARAVVYFPLFKEVYAEFAGDIYSDLKYYTLALALYRLALLIHQQLGNDEDLARVYIATCSCCDWLGLYEDAIANGESALKILKSTPNRIARAATYNNLANVYERLGNHEKALEYIQTAIRLAKPLKEEEKLATFYSSEANIYSNMGNYKAGLKSMEASLAIMKRFCSQDDPMLANAYNNLASIYLDMHRDLSTTEKYIRRALSIYQTHGYPADHLVFLSVYSNLSNVCQCQKKNAEAMEAALMALQIDEQHQTAELPNTLNTAACAYFNNGNYIQAKQLLLRSLELYDRNGAPVFDRRKIAYQNYLMCCQKLGEIPSYRKKSPQ